MISNIVDINLILIFITIGVISSLIYNAFGLIKVITKKNILVVNILDFFCVIVCGILLIQTIFIYKNGHFALFELALFAFGVIFGQFIVENLFTSPIKWVYNKFNLRKKNSFVKVNNGEIEWFQIKFRG